MVLEHKLQVGSLTVTHTVLLILWIVCSGSKEGQCQQKIVIAQICEELSKDKRIFI